MAAVFSVKAEGCNASAWMCGWSFEVVNSSAIGDGIGKGFLITTKQLLSWLFKRYCLLTNLSV